MNNYGYKALQSFYHDNKQVLDAILSYPERLLVNSYFLDAKAKKRLDAPEKLPLINKVADILLERAKNIRTETQAFTVAESAMETGLTKLEMRLRLFEEDGRNGIHSDGTLALVAIDWSLVCLLRDSGLKTRRLVALAPNESITAIKGIDDKKLGQIRKRIPHQTERKMRTVASTANPQPALF